MKTVYNYMYKKFVAAGFLFFVFTCVVCIMINFNFYELSSTLANPWLWIAFYPYAIITSMIIDRITHTNLVSKDKSKYLTLIGYLFFGFIPFVFIFPSIPYILIAGTIGVLCAGVFYIGVYISSNFKKASIVFSCIVPVLLIIVMISNFTMKTNWQEVKTNADYQVTFDYFNGHHKIPIELEKGDKMTYQVETTSTNGGGWGNYVEGPTESHVPMEIKATKEEIEPEAYYLTANENGTYYIVITGNRLTGAIFVEWMVEEA